MKRRCEDPLISQTLGFDTYRMGNCIKTDNESKYKIEELTKGKHLVEHFSTIVCGKQYVAKKWPRSRCILTYSLVNFRFF